jgi:ectoine hydroxylase
MNLHPSDLRLQPDPYPTRVAERPVCLDRQDPVLWGETWGEGGPLGWSDLRFFDTHGYVFFESLFTTDEVASLQAELDALGDDPGLRDRPEAIREPESEALRSIFAPHTFSPTFDRLSRDPRLLDAAQQVLGSDVYLHQARVNVKPGFEGKEFYWHSDFETWHAEDGMPRMRAVSFSLLLAANDAFNGSLMVMPGSHRTFVSCVGETPEDNYKRSLRQQETGVPDKKSLATLVERCGLAMPTGPAGSVLLFDCNLMHGSASNISPWPRSNVFFCYNSVENALQEPFAGTRPRPDFVAHRDPVPLVRPRPQD